MLMLVPVAMAVVYIGFLFTKPGVDHRTAIKNFFTKLLKDK